MGRQEGVGKALQGQAGGGAVDSVAIRFTW